MKRTTYIGLFTIVALILTACSTAHQPYAYDDVYYNPENDPIKQAEKDPRQDLQKTDNIQYDNSYPNRYTNNGENNNAYPEGIYQNRYTEAETQENNNQEVSGNNQTVIINNNTNDETEYYDPEYAQAVQALNTPVQSFNSYDPYLRSRIAYTNDPFFYGPSMYSNYNFYDPFMPASGLSVGWNSWSGWNVGIGIGFGYAAWGYSNHYYNPWRPMYGYNPWNPWAPMFGYGWGYGWGCDPYWAGYNHGYYNGYNNGAYYGDHSGGSSTKRINTPRGSNGSRAFTEPRQNTRAEGSNGNYRLSGTENSNARMARPSQSQPTQGTESGRRTRTPGRYATDKTPETYSRPSREQQRPSVTGTPNSNIQPNVGTARPSREGRMPSSTTPSINQRNSQSRPYSNDSYNSRRPINPSNQNYQSRPSIQTEPSNSMNRSRPSYNRTPTYTPTPSMGGSRPSRSASPSRSRPSNRPRR